MDRFTRYLAGLLGTVLIGGLAVAGACLLVDPYRMLALIEIPDFNQRKPQAGLQIRLNKAYDARRAAPDAIILGNSRVEAGIDPEHPALIEAGLRPFNLGIPGAGMFEQLRYLQHAIHGQRLRLLIVGLDFVDFLARPDARSPFEQPVREFEGRLVVDRNGAPNRTRGRALAGDFNVAFFSLNSVADSVLTVLGQGIEAGHRTPLGFNPLDEYHRLVRLEGHFSLFEQRDRENLQQRMAGPRTTRDPRGGLGFSYEILRRMMDIARAEGAEVILFIHPYHARILEIFRIAGLWSAFESWKRDITKLVQESSSGDWRKEPELWDFSGYTTWTMEPVPKRGDVTTQMKWYWEAGHYKAELGRQLLDRMLISGHEDVRGVRLRPENVEVRISSIRAARRGYLQDFSQDVEALERRVN
ncbi:MAG: hypothetical protein KIT20_00190 [Alphaproteobacteria bacterium]|nr:hypothetical protein [Alphaproteobacteria bacterium]